MKNSKSKKGNSIKTLMFLIILQIFNLTNLQSSISQVKQEWAATYKTNNNEFDRAIKTIVDKEENIFVTGTTKNVISNSDILTIKYNSKGELLWLNIYQSHDNYYDFPTSIDLDSEGNIIIAGFRCFSQYISPNWSDFVVIKYDTEGNQEWVNIYDRNHGDDMAFSVKTDSQRNVYVAGISEKLSYSEDFDFKIIKYDTFGKLIWQREYEGLPNSVDRISDMLIDNNENVIVTGSSQRIEIPHETEIVTLKYNSDGKLLWGEDFSSGSKFNTPGQMKSDNLGNIFISMESRDSLFNQFHGVVKYSPEGKKIFHVNYAKSNYIISKNISVDDTGNFFINYANYSIDPDIDKGMFIIKFNNEGKVIWVNEVKPIKNFKYSPVDIQNDGMGNVYIAGTSYSESNSYFVTIKHDKNGNLKWQEYYGGITKDRNWVASMDLDNTGNIVITGSSYDNNFIGGISTVKYSQTDLTKLQNTFETRLIKSYNLSQNIPNPFNPVTLIQFELPQQSFVKLKVYDLSGREVATLVNEEKHVGIHSVTFDGSNLSSGVYFYRIVSDNFTQTKKMTLIK